MFFRFIIVFPCDYEANLGALNLASLAEKNLQLFLCLFRQLNKLLPGTVDVIRHIRTIGIQWFTTLQGENLRLASLEEIQRLEQEIDDLLLEKIQSGS